MASFLSCGGGGVEDEEGTAEAPPNTPSPLLPSDTEPIGLSFADNGRALVISGLLPAPIKANVMLSYRTARRSVTVTTGNGGGGNSGANISEHEVRLSEAASCEMTDNARSVYFSDENVQVHVELLENGHLNTITPSARSSSSSSNGCGVWASLRVHLAIKSASTTTLVTGANSSANCSTPPPDDGSSADKVAPQPEAGGKMQHPQQQGQGQQGQGQQQQQSGADSEICEITPLYLWLELDCNQAWTRSSDLRVYQNGFNSWAPTCAKGGSERQGLPPLGARWAVAEATKLIHNRASPQWGRAGLISHLVTCMSNTSATAADFNSATVPGGNSGCDEAFLHGILAGFIDHTVSINEFFWDPRTRCLLCQLELGAPLPIPQAFPPVVAVSSTLPSSDYSATTTAAATAAAATTTSVSQAWLTTSPLVFGRGQVQSLLRIYADATMVTCSRDAAAGTVTASNQPLGPRPIAKTAPVGWCSWYEYYTKVTADRMLDNTEALARYAHDMPETAGVGLVQLDDGYQLHIGDWLDCQPRKFPNGLAPVVSRIRQAGLQAGIWVAPFIAGGGSKVWNEHPEWFLRTARGQPVRALWNPAWNYTGDLTNYALDTTHPGALAYLTRVFAVLVDLGISMFKIDFTAAAILPGVRFDRNATRAEAFRRGVAAVRAGAPEAFILGCGAPLGASVGLVDGMRVSADTENVWRPGWFNRLVASHVGLPSVQYQLQSDLGRQWMDRHWWTNDPDVVIPRAHDTYLSQGQVQAQLTVVGMLGGMLLFSDDLRQLDTERLQMMRQISPTSRLGARVVDLMDSQFPSQLALGERGGVGGGVVSFLNWHLSRPHEWTVNATMLQRAATVLGLQGWCSDTVSPPHASSSGDKTVDDGAVAVSSPKAAVKTPMSDTSNPHNCTLTAPDALLWDFWGTRPVPLDSVVKVAPTGVCALLVVPRGKVGCPQLLGTDFGLCALADGRIIAEYRDEGALTEANATAAAAAATASAAASAPAAASVPTSDATTIVTGTGMSMRNGRLWFLLPPGCAPFLGATDGCVVELRPDAAVANAVVMHVRVSAALPLDAKWMVSIGATKPTTSIV
eukprot:UC1_evm4s1936